MKKKKMHNFYRSNVDGEKFYDHDSMIMMECQCFTVLSGLKS